MSLCEEPAVISHMGVPLMFIQALDSCKLPCGHLKIKMIARRCEIIWHGLGGDFSAMLVALLKMDLFLQKLRSSFIGTWTKSCAYRLALACGLLPQETLLSATKSPPMRSNFD